MLLNYSFDAFDPQVIRSFAPGLPITPVPKSTGAALAGGIGATAALPGPAAGDVRFYSSVNIISNTLAAPLANVTIDLLPGPFTIDLAQSGAQTLLSSQPPALFPGESFLITNGGANPGVVFGTYLDVPIPQAFAVRMNVTDVAANMIPAAGANRVNMLLSGYGWDVNGYVHSTNLRFFNADTIPHQVQILSVGIGGLPIMRSAAAAAGAFFVMSGGWNIQRVDQASGALQVQLTEAVAVTPPTAVLAYRTLPNA